MLTNAKFAFLPKKAIGKGGEADVYNIGKGKALKVFKTSSHPDYVGLPFEQQAASKRLLEHQDKLQKFPRNLPIEVICPEQLATDKFGHKVLGYTMTLIKDATPLFKYSDRNFRIQNGINNSTITQIFSELTQNS